MNKISLSTMFIVSIILSLIYVNETFAKEKITTVTEPLVDAKCFVELIGGGETISLWIIKPSALSSLSNNIVGKEILLIPTTEQFRKQKHATIYKANQCVFAQDDFASAKARVMDEETPR